MAVWRIMPIQATPHWLDAISASSFMDEAHAVAALPDRTRDLDALDSTIRTRAAALITHQRAHGASSTVEAFLQSYGLSTKEGIAMMCLAEALLRIPDATTADQ